MSTDEPRVWGVHAGRTGDADRLFLKKSFVALGWDMIGDLTLGTFTNQAKTFARSKSNLRLIDGPELVELILPYCDRFVSRYKSMIPLKKVFVPQPIGEEIDSI